MLVFDTKCLQRDLNSAFKHNFKEKPCECLVGLLNIN